MNVKDHYDNHLAKFYVWMAGDLMTQSQQFSDFLLSQNISPSRTGVALDLGAGHGIQSLALGKMGYKVKAIDFTQELLDELAVNAGSAPIEVIRGDIRTVKDYQAVQAELIVCGGDTLTHLASKSEIKSLLIDCYETLIPGGKLVLSFRDYSKALEGESRFIPVKSDADRIHTCFLEYGPEKVKVTDLLHERVGENWEQKVSSYEKVRLTAVEVVDWLQEAGFQLIFHKVKNRMPHVIASKFMFDQTSIASEW